ncbi:MAG: minor capsid protein [Ottowia sp.]|nr:minor capsid protein [Ottowia sp.]
MKPSVAAILKKSFADRAAIESLARRKERITSHSHEVWNEEHARAFTIAGLARLDILQEIRAGLERTVSGDLSRTEWESDVRALLKDAGLWTDKEGKRRSKADAGKFAPSRLRLIFDTNTASAYAAGRWTRLWERRETHPYLMYLTKQDERVRITHRRWHGLVLPIDHPFWQTHFPPNGFRCRCAVLGVTQVEYDRAHSGEETEIAGQRVHLDAPPEMTVAHVNRATGEIVQVPVGITPGFNYNPGMALARERELAALVAQKTAGLDDAMLQAHVAATRTQPLSGSANTAPETAPAPHPWQPKACMVQPDDVAARILQGEAVASVSRADAPAGKRSDVIDAAAEIFKQQGGKAARADIGETLMDYYSAKDSAYHGHLSQIKRATFGAIQSVVERGALVLHARHGTKNEDGNDMDSFYICAPVLIDGVENIMAVFVRWTRGKQYAYLHEVATKESLLSRGAGRGENAGLTGTQTTEGESNVAHSIRRGKFKREEINARLLYLLTMKPLPPNFQP